MSLTPFQRWQKRTNDGRKMAGGWTHAKYDPPKIWQYEVQGHPHYNYLTWAYGAWWHQSVGDDRDGRSGCWTRKKGRFNWKASPWRNCTVNWGSVMHQAATLGNEEAKQDLAKAVSEWNKK